MSNLEFKPFENYDEMSLNASIIPLELRADTFKRISDWLSSEGNTIEDDYVKNQIDVVNKVLKMRHDKLTKGL